MRRRRAGVILSFIVATLVLVIGYASVVDINLSVSGTASAGASNENFNVQLIAGSLDSSGSSSNISVTNTTTVAGVDEKQLAVKFSAEGFSAKGDKAVVTYTIKNTSNDLDALLSSSGVSVSVPENTNDITYYSNGASLFNTSFYFDGVAGTLTKLIDSEDDNTTTVSVVIELNETILEQENVVVNINLPIVAKAQ